MQSKRFAAVVLSCLGMIAVGGFYMKSPTITWQWALLAFYIAVHFWLLFRHWSQLYWSWGKGTGSAFLGAAWIYSSHDKPFGSLNVVGVVAAMLAVCMIAFTFYLTISELERPFERQTKSVSPWSTLLYACIPFVVWMVYFLAYFPGKMTYDSFWQWDQAHGIKLYNDWHPILHTWLIQASTWIYNSPGTYILLQIITLSLVVGYALYVLRKLGVPTWLILTLDCIYALNPVNGFYAVTMWKDIPFAAAILLLTSIFTQIVQSKGLWLHNKWHFAVFVIVCFFAMDLRHNGPEAVVAALVVFVLFMRDIRVRLLVSLIPILGLYYLFNGPLMNYAHVVKNPLDQALAIPSQQIAATYKYHGKFTPQLASYFDSILPAANWAKDDNPYTVNPIKHDGAYNANVIQGNFGLYLDNWAKLLVLNPVRFVRAYLEQVAVVWQFHSAKGLHPYFDTPQSLQEYPAGLRIMAPDKSTTGVTHSLIVSSYHQYTKEIRSHFPGLAAPTYQQFQKRVMRALNPLKSKSQFPLLQVILNKVFWHINNTWSNYLLKGAVPFFLFWLSLIPAWRRFRWKGLIPFTPVLFLMATLLIAMPATDYRYSFSWIFTGWFLVLYGKLALSQETEEPYGTK